MNDGGSVRFACSRHNLQQPGVALCSHSGSVGGTDESPLSPGTRTSSVPYFGSHGPYMTKKLTAQRTTTASSSLLVTESHKTAEAGGLKSLGLSGTFQNAVGVPIIRVLRRPDLAH